VGRKTSFAGEGGLEVGSRLASVGLPVGLLLHSQIIWNSVPCQAAEYVICRKPEGANLAGTGADSEQALDSAYERRHCSEIRFQIA
jgi:hypothetical protein